MPDSIGRPVHWSTRMTSERERGQEERGRKPRRREDPAHDQRGDRHQQGGEPEGGSGRADVERLPAAEEHEPRRRQCGQRRDQRDLGERHGPPQRRERENRGERHSRDRRVAEPREHPCVSQLVDDARRDVVGLELGDELCGRADLCVRRRAACRASRQAHRGRRRRESSARCRGWSRVPADGSTPRRSGRGSPHRR